MANRRDSCMIVALIWALLLAMPVLAHTESDPATFPLVYGNTEIQIGWVKVWNDDNLHLEYEITEAGWGIEETHVLVTLTPIPWTGVPGHYIDQHAFTDPPGYPTTDFYVISELGSGPYGHDDPKLPVSGLSECTIVYIIAHAAVIGPTGQQETAFGNSFRDADTVIGYHIQRENGPPDIPALPLFAFPAGLGVVGLTYVWRRKTG